jgi:hypothetical protein
MTVVESDWLCVGCHYGTHFLLSEHEAHVNTDSNNYTTRLLKKQLV